MRRGEEEERLRGGAVFLEVLKGSGNPGLRPRVPASEFNE